MEPRFVVDVNVGRLGKWLRILGYDVLFIPDVEDNELVRIAIKENRVLVTKDSGLARRRLVSKGFLKMVLVRCDNLKDQLAQVVNELGLGSEQQLSRCIRCNHELVNVPRTSVESRVPQHVFRTQQEFMECPSCQRVYWRGTHWDNMTRDLLTIRVT